MVDLSRLVAGNMVSLQLADQGAEVIKIEDPRTGDPLRAWRVKGLSLHWKVYARNKKSLAINLRPQAGRDALCDLLAQSHVLIENYRPGTLEEMGLGPDVLHARNPGLIIVRITGFGQDGPYRDRPGFGTLVEAMSGFASKNGFGDRAPVLPPLALADMVAGLYGAYAVMIALRVVERGGAGQVIDLPLLDPIISILGPDAAIHRVSGERPQRTGSRSLTTSPRNVYATKDGRYIAISASIQAMAERVFRAIGRPEMIDDPRFRTNTDRVRHIDECDGAVAEFIAAAHAGREHGGVPGGGGDRDAGVRDRSAGGGRAHPGTRCDCRGAGRGGGIGADAQRDSAAVRDAREAAAPGAGAGAAHARGAAGDRVFGRKDCGAGGGRGGEGGVTST